MNIILCDYEIHIKLQSTAYFNFVQHFEWYTWSQIFSPSSLVCFYSLDFHVCNYFVHVHWNAAPSSYGYQCNPNAFP